MVADVSTGSFFPHPTKHKANKAMKVGFIAATIPPLRTGASVGGSSPLPIPWGFLPHPKLPLQPAGFPEGRELVFARFDRPLTMPAGVVLPLTVLAQAFLPVRFITHRGSVRGWPGQWLTHSPGCFQENFVPARTHLYRRAERFFNPRPPSRTNSHTGRAEYCALVRCVLRVVRIQAR